MQSGAYNSRIPNIVRTFPSRLVGSHRVRSSVAVERAGQRPELGRSRRAIGGKDCIGYRPENHGRGSAESLVAQRCNGRRHPAQSSDSACRARRARFVGARTGRGNRAGLAVRGPAKLCLDRRNSRRVRIHLRSSWFPCRDRPRSQSNPTAAAMVLRRIPLWSQPERILDVAVIDGNPARMLVLDANGVTSYRLQDNHWQLGTIASDHPLAAVAARSAGKAGLRR